MTSLLSRDEARSERGTATRVFFPTIRSPFTLAAIGLAIVNCISLSFDHEPVLLGGLCFLLVVVVLGSSVYVLFPASPRDGAVAAYLVTCLGIAVLLLIGLAANQLLPLIGEAHPLSRIPALLSVDATFVVLAALGRRRWPRSMGSGHPAWGASASPGAVLAQAGRSSLSLVALAALPTGAASGAVALDNGHAATLTLVVLVVCCGVLAHLVWNAPMLSRRHLLVALYAVSLTLLLMTSVRGRFVTGHDIQHEFFVFKATKSDWRWSATSIRSAYNACLSITILPTMVAGMFHVSDVQIFKTLFQMLFALCPLRVYLVAERLSDARQAVLAAVVFVSFPTFFSDMPMLNRQEIAMLLLCGMILLIVDRQPDRVAGQKALFMMLGIGKMV